MPPEDPAPRGSILLPGAGVAMTILGLVLGLYALFGRGGAGGPSYPSHMSGGAPAPASSSGYAADYRQDRTAATATPVPAATRDPRPPNRYYYP